MKKLARNEKMHGVNSERLKFARVYYDFSTEEVYERLNIKLEELNNLESGKVLPSYAKLNKLAELYKRPLLYFFFPSPPEEDNLNIAFRKVQDQIQRPLDLQVRLMIEKANGYKLNLQELYSNDERTSFSCLIKEEENEIDSDAKLNEYLRKKLDLPISKQKEEFRTSPKLLEYIREKLYEIGIYVFKDSFKADDVSGLCLYDEQYPVILINNKTSFTRQLFTVFHELYHIWQKETSIYLLDNNEEKACDTFASEFLIPSSDFDLLISKTQDIESIQVISDIAGLYKVSPEAIAYRLKSQQRISNEFYASIRQNSEDIRKSNSESSGGNFYFTRMSYLGKAYLKVVFNNYYSGKIDVTAVGKYTGLKSAHVPRLASNMFGGDF